MADCPEKEKVVIKSTLTLYMLEQTHLDDFERDGSYFFLLALLNTILKPFYTQPMIYIFISELSVMSLTIILKLNSLHNLFTAVMHF